MEIWTLLGMILGMIVLFIYLPEDHNKIKWLPTIIVMVLSGPIMWVIAFCILSCICLNKLFKFLDKFNFNNKIKNIFTK